MTASRSPVRLVKQNPGSIEGLHITASKKEILNISPTRQVDFGFGSESPQTAELRDFKRDSVMLEIKSMHYTQSS
jgi:hypothetical protein